MSSLSYIDLTVLAVYAVSIFTLAQWVSREKPGHVKDSKDYFLASRALPWWAIGTSLIAANISAEQIIGMSGSGYVIGLGIASYEWMAALTLLIVGKFFLPIFLRNQIYTMPEFLQRRYGSSVRLVAAVFWLALYVLVNLTSILWLGATAIHTVTGVDIELALIGLGAFAGAYALYGGLKAVALTDIVQVSLLVLGGLVIVYIALDKISGHSGLLGVKEGFQILQAQMPGKFEMILSPDNPNYKNLPGLSVLIGGMWIMNVSYWGFNQYIIQRALAAKNTREAQKGIVLAAFLKLLMPVLVVLPGIAAGILAPRLEKADMAYPFLMTLLPPGLLGLVFAALIAAIIASMGSKINSIATIFTIDLYKPVFKKASETHLVVVGRIAAVTALIIAMIAAKPLLGNLPQVFQYIQEYSGFVTPGIVVIFILGMFWSRATTAGAFVGAVGSVVLSVLYWKYWPEVPFMNRIGYVFLLCLGAAMLVSLLQPKRARTSTIELSDIDYSTSLSFNIASVVVIAILVALYTYFW
jgi:SSS family solute:Na+ symporter